MKCLTFLAPLSTVLGWKPVVLGYYAPWGNMNVTQIPYSKLTHIQYAFGTLTNRKDPSQVALDAWYDKPKLMEIVELARKSKNRPKVSLSVGGWTGSQTFSLMVRDQNHRAKFIQQLLKFLEPTKGGEKPGEMPETWGLDGIDLDWEFPNRMGAQCNVIHKNDTSNYLILLKELKRAMTKKFGNKKLLTAAVRVETFDDENGVPRKDVREFAKYFDFISIMAYDIHGPWSDTTGPASPLRYRKGKGVQLSLSQSLRSWHKAGFPKSKLVGGLAFYGKAMEAKVKVTSKTQFVPQTKARIMGDSSDVQSKNSLCDEGTLYSGNHKYNILRQDILKKSPTRAIRGYKRYFDKVSMTPYLYQESKRKFISYEDPTSIRAKAEFIKNKGYRGAMMWELSQDYNDELLDSIHWIRNKVSAPRRKSSRRGPTNH